MTAPDLLGRMRGDHSMMMLKLRMDMPRTFELIRCEAPSGVPVVHFRYKGKLYMNVRGMREASEYRQRIYKMVREPSSADERICSKCGKPYRKD